MQNEKLVKNWIDFADMDAKLAEFTFTNMYPKPLELICYHCQQSAEKMLKGVLIASVANIDVPKTHDLAFLADMLSEKFEINDNIYNACSDLTPYGVKIRYPKEIRVDEPMTQKALNDMKKILNWCNNTLNKLR